MKELAIQERLRLIEKQLDVLGDSIESLNMDIKEEVAILRIELGTLKAFLMQLHPGLKTQYPRIKKMVTAKVDPDRLK